MRQRTPAAIPAMAWVLSLILVMSAGCSWDPPTPVATEAAGAQYTPPGAKGGTIEKFTAPDGKELGYVAYKSGAKTALVYLHGIESHAGWFSLAADQLGAQGTDVFCLDRRGSGINRENRGFVSGHVNDYRTLLTDIHSFIAPLRKDYQQVYLAGLSWGGKLALAYALEYPGTTDGLILITPGIAALVDVSLPQKLQILSLSLLSLEAGIPVPIEAEMFTTTPVYLDYIKRDPLRLKSASARFFFQSHRLDQLVAKRVAENRTPVLLFLAGHDRIIDNQGVSRLLAKSSLPVETRHYPDQTHSIQLDAPDRLVADIQDWLRRYETQPATQEETP